MTTITCPKCDYRFETTATTNTRCRQCRHVCTVPRTSSRPEPRRGARPQREAAERWDYGLDLLCGHVVVSSDDDTAPDDVDELLWRCPVCNTFEQVAAVVGYLPADEAPFGWDELLGNLFGEDDAAYERAWDQLGDDEDDDDDDEDQLAVTSP